MENPFKNAGEEEKTLTPVERIREAREKAKLPENIEYYLAGGVGDVAKLEVLTRYAEQYPEGASAGAIAALFESMLDESNFNSKEGMPGRRLGNAAQIKTSLEKIEKEIGEDGMKKLMDGKNPSEQK